MIDQVPDRVALPKKQAAVGDLDADACARRGEGGNGKGNVSDLLQEGRGRRILPPSLSPPLHENSSLYRFFRQLLDYHYTR